MSILWNKHGMSNGLLIVLSGPSGVGKGSLIEALLKETPGLSFSISATTRPPRDYEKEGIHYFFLTKSAFEEKIKQDELLEWAEVHGHYYGTPQGPIEEKLKNQHHVILDIDVQGAMQVKKRIPEAVLIFLAPPKFADLYNRLKGRRTEKTAAIEQRLQDAKQELQAMKAYEYLVINDILKDAVEDVKAILRAEKCKITRRSKEVEDALS